MRIEAIGNGNPPIAIQVQALHVASEQSGVRQTAMTAGAKALGITRAELQIALARGQSLVSIAADRDVSIATLTAMIGGAVSKANPSLSGDRTQLITQRMISTPGSGGPGGVTAILGRTSH